MGHRSYLRYHPRTLPGAPRDSRRRPGRGDKKKGIGASSSRSARFVITLREVRLPGGSIGAAFRSIGILILDGWTVGPDRAEPVGGSPRSSTAVVFGTEQSAELTDGPAGSKTQERAERLISGLEAKFLEEEPGVAGSTLTSGVEWSSGSINELIPSDITGLLGHLSVRFIKSIRRKVGEIGQLTVVDLEEGQPIIGRLITFRRLSNARLITHVGRVDRLSRYAALILPSESDKPADQLSQPAIRAGTRPRGKSRFFSSRGASTRVTVPFPAAAMTSGRRTSFR